MNVQVTKPMEVSESLNVIKLKLCDYDLHYVV